MSKSKVDYSLYLVTGRELLPPGKDYYESLEESLKGGVTVVQIREKDVDTGEFVEIARKTKEITDKYNVPLLINDRIDIHLAIQSSGIHIGQTDMPLSLARQIVGPNAIIGVSCSTPEDAARAVAEGADYIGVGPVWPTGSKDVSKKVLLAPSGVGEILDVINGTGVESVAIGGIHPPNVPFLLHASTSPLSRNHLSGIAVISAIVSSTYPESAAQRLRGMVDSFKRARKELGHPVSVFTERKKDVKIDLRELMLEVGGLMDVVRKETPLVHQITNNVVINDSANATLAVGASPIMATNAKDVADLSPAIGALLVNFGTITDKEGMLVAGRQANVNRKPVIYDPVAVGATSYRRQTSKELLAWWQPCVIKGNAAEIASLSESTEVSTRGVDSVGSGFSDPATIVKALARKKSAIVVLTGPSDYISDGEVVLKASNGHELLGNITGSGCMTGTLVATFCAAARLHRLQQTKPAFEEESQLVQGNMLVGALAGVLVFNIAAELAAAREDVKGPGTFRSALLDELYTLKPDVVLKRANIQILSV